MWPVCQDIGLPLLLAWRFDFETQMWKEEVDVRLVLRICATRSCRNKTRLDAYASGCDLLGSELSFAVHAALCMLQVLQRHFCPERPCEPAFLALATSEASVLSQTQREQPCHAAEHGCS